MNSFVCDFKFHTITLSLNLFIDDDVMRSILQVKQMKKDADNSVKLSDERIIVAVAINNGESCLERAEVSRLLDDTISKQLPYRYHHGIENKDITKYGSKEIFNHIMKAYIFKARSPIYLL